MVTDNNGKYIVAAVGIAAVAAIEIVNLATHGPDATATSAVVGAVTLIVGWVLGKRTQ